MKLDMRKKQEKKETTKSTKKLPMTAKIETCHGSVYCNGTDYDSRSKYCICGRRSTDRYQ